MATSARNASPTRIVGFGFVLLLHVAFIYSLVTALKYRTVEVAPVPIVAKIIEAAKPPSRPPAPLPPPAFAPPPPPFVPPPEVQIKAPPPPPAQSTAITNVTPVPPPAAPPASPHEPVTVMPHVDLAASREPEYPPASRRLGEQGTVVLDVLIDASGRVTDAKVVRSSGFPRLDQAALEGVKASYHFVPGTIDGKPAPMQYTFRFNWKLQ